MDPSTYRKAQKAARAERAANSFEVVAREWFDRNAPTLVPKHADRILGRLENDVFPWIGGRAVGEVTPPELLAVVRRVETRGAVESAHRVLAICSQVFRYAVATGRALSEPSRDLRGALPPSSRTTSPLFTEPKRVGELLRAIDGYEGTFPVTCALKAGAAGVRPSRRAANG